MLMTDNNENPLDNMDEEYPFEDFEAETTVSGGSESTPERRPRSGNRNFWVAVGILAAVFVVVVIILTVIAFIIVPQNRQAKLEEAALINAHNTATSQAATDLAALETERAKPTQTPIPSATTEPTATPVVVLPSETPIPPTDTAVPEIGGAVDDPARTATVAALLTQAASSGTQIATTTGGGALTPTALPQTGLGDDTNWPMWVGLGLGLVVVIFLVRRLRLSISS
jgi:LPXTG-motif cell wall-anchored protein